MNRFFSRSSVRTRWIVLFALISMVVGIVCLLPSSSDRLPKPPNDPLPDAVAPYAGPYVFHDRTADSGIAFTYRNGEEADRYSILESLGGGIALVDFDGDGLLDIVVTGGGYFEPGEPPQIRGYSNRLYRNLGNWKFQDVTAEVGLDHPVFYSHGVAVGDINRDGWPDLLITGYGQLALYENRSAEPGKPNSSKRLFVDVTREYGLPNLPWSTSAAFGDLDGDGYPELYVCQYVDWSFAKHPSCSTSMSKGPRDVCPPQRFAALPHKLFRNTGKGKFVDITEESKLRIDGKGLGVVIADLNGDGLPDIYAANDASDNFLYLNRGKGRLEEKGALAGVAVDENGYYNGSMGATVGDFNRSGFPSLFVTNFQDEWHALYLNLGKERFQFATHAAGIARLGQEYVGFGTAFFDWDNDGWEDLVIANGHVFRHPAKSEVGQWPILLRNEAIQNRRQFERVADRAGEYFQSKHRGRGVAVGDLDNDGWPDLVISHQNEPIILLQNRAKELSATPNHWLGIELVGRGHRDITGTRVTVESGGESHSRWATHGGSYLSENDPRLLFGLGQKGKVERITIDWSHGGKQVIQEPVVDRYSRFQE